MPRKKKKKKIPPATVSEEKEIKKQQLHWLSWKDSTIFLRTPSEKSPGKPQSLHSLKLSATNSSPSIMRTTTFFFLNSSENLKNIFFS